MKFAIVITLLICGNFYLNHIEAQTASLKGVFKDAEGAEVSFANVILFNAKDSSMAKVEATKSDGQFHFQNLKPGSYFLKSTYVGLEDYQKNNIKLQQDQQLDLGILQFSESSVQLKETTISTKRTILEVKSDRTVFNVDGTINAIGSDALGLLRKAPGVTVDNNDNINVLGRSGVLIYVDGKRVPLNGQDLSNYLQNLSADQIDRIEIISNPGAKYEAQGNAGIIDIRLKRDKNLGSNGSVSMGYMQGRYPKSNISGNVNYRNKLFNLFGNAGIGQWKGFNRLEFESFQNDLYLEEVNENIHKRLNLNLRLGLDYFISKTQTIGFLISGMDTDGSNIGVNRIDIAKESSPSQVDSILIANTKTINPKSNQTYNLNYRFDNSKDRNFNIDLDYGIYRSESRRNQSNLYYDATEQNQLSEALNSFDTPSDIDIATLKMDYEQKILGGKLSLGTKLSRVVSDNTYLVYDGYPGLRDLDNRRSNQFNYVENVFAGYFNFNRNINKTLSFTAGLRAEQTDAHGDLQAFLPELQQPPVILNYLSWFPSAGLSYQWKPKQTFNLNYGRRINRPDYNVLNPFNNQLSQLSFEKGNPFLRPEIVNNIELGYTLAYKYNFKIAYSQTTDQITRLIGPDTVDVRASFISWDNLAKQTLWNFNASLPFELTKHWNVYFNLGASHIDNQANYGGDAVVDLQAFTYSIFQQHTIDLPYGFKGEISGYYSGPGIWGGVFLYESSWSLDIGIQKKFLNERLNVRVSGSDLFYESGWEGISVFNGLSSAGRGNWDSRRFNINMSYRFGNDNVKSRKRKVGLEDEAGRVEHGN
jgi:outer membrane receptor protein involved in Fe transport